MLQLQDLISYFEDSALADNIRENDLLFPLIESVHVVSICLVVGSILAVDLRLLGLASLDRSVSRVTQRNFAAHLVRVCRRRRLGQPDVHFQRHQISGERLFRRQDAPDLRGRPEHGDLSCHQRQGPAAMGRTRPGCRCRRGWPGGLSILLWISVVACGRWIGFTMRIG